MDGRAPDLPIARAQSATVGSLLGSLSADEKFGVLVGLLKYFEPAQQSTASANKVMSVVEALMADKPSSDLATLIGAPDALRLQQMTPPAEMKKVTCDIGVQASPLPAILPPPRTFEDRGTTTVSQSNKKEATTQTIAIGFTERAASPVAPSNRTDDQSRNTLHEVIDVDDDKQLDALSRKLIAGRRRYEAEDIVDMELRGLGSLFDAIMHPAISEKPPSGVEAVAPAAVVPSLINDTRSTDRHAPKMVEPEQGVETSQSRGSDRSDVLSAAEHPTSHPPSKRKKAQNTVESSRTEGDSASKRPRTDASNPLKRKRAAAPSGNTGTDLSTSLGGAADHDAGPSKPKRRKRSTGTTEAVDTEVNVSNYRSVRLIAQKLAPQDIPMETPAPPKVKGGPRGRPRKPKITVEGGVARGTGPPSSSILLGTEAKQTYGGRRRNKVSNEDETALHDDNPRSPTSPVAGPSARRISPSTSLSQEEQDAQDAAHSLATLYNGGRQNGHGPLDTSALEQLALAAQQEDERRSRSPRSPQDQSAQQSQIRGQHQSPVSPNIAQASSLNVYASASAERAAPTATEPLVQHISPRPSPPISSEQMTVDPPQGHHASHSAAQIAVPQETEPTRPSHGSPHLDASSGHMQLDMTMRSLSPQAAFTSTSGTSFASLSTLDNSLHDDGGQKRPNSHLLSDTQDALPSASRRSDNINADAMLIDPPNPPLSSSSHAPEIASPTSQQHPAPSLSVDLLVQHEHTSDPLLQKDFAPSLPKTVTSLSSAMASRLPPTTSDFDGRPTASQSRSPSLEIVFDNPRETLGGQNHTDALSAHDATLASELTSPTLLKSDKPSDGTVARDSEGSPISSTRGRGRGRGGRGRGRGRGGSATVQPVVKKPSGRGRGRGRARGKPIPVSPFIRPPVTTGDSDTEDEEPNFLGPSTSRLPAAKQRQPNPKRSSSLPPSNISEPLSPSSQLDLIDDEIRQNGRAGTPFAHRGRDSPFPSEAKEQLPLEKNPLRFRLPALPKSQPGAPYVISANPVPDLPSPVAGPSHGSGRGASASTREHETAIVFRDAVANLRRADSGSTSGSRENSVSRSFGSFGIGQGARRRVSFVVPDGYDKEG